ncbi:hypothetical protein [Seonamhaeicola sp.]|uniref:hypothetical protein n=1 Tax=Seonamhaeicola sp. TaxID=1912245 RepID=UPI00261F37CF|nr:hypothetical protein [Seonamhaeicola sp.]
MKSRKYFLLNYVFVFGVILLFLNDHFLKYQFSNWFTGKLSDFIGLLIFPCFLSFIFPNRIKLNVVFTGLFFVFWKSSYSQGLIEFYNSIALIKITRVVDYSDLIALLVLPLSYYLLTNKDILSRYAFGKIEINPLVVLLPAIIVFMATSPPYWHGFRYSEGDIQFFKNTIKVRMSQEDVLKTMERYNIEAVIDTSYKDNPYSDGPIQKMGFYHINELVIDTDTIIDLKFSMVSFKEDKTKIFINAMKVSEDIKEDEVKGELRKYYKKLLRKYIKKSLK